MGLDVNRSQAPRLNMEADRLAIKLLRQHNHASVLARNTPLNCAIGLFGLAQAGKSYLIGALAVRKAAWNVHWVTAWWITPASSIHSNIPQIWCNASAASSRAATATGRYSSPC
ncbi:virulence factor SrfC family protein [Erwinia sp. MYb535]|uniref:virulence factor SrfC family protein n=1 Tax=Erwinia sp. MYb535 TaxID=2745309 RepID=UPI0030AFD3E9